ncbi:MAG: OadG family protein [Epsilonproteobacteria bacterium]|nr:OadG family protein [Campylobacterota bacterium]
MQIVLIEEGLKFLVLGMTTVYLFLYLMVIVLKFEHKIIKKYFPEKKKQTATASVATPQKNISNDDDEIVAAITAAIIEHRK